MKKEILILLLVFSISFSLAFEYEKLQDVEIPSDLQRVLGKQQVNVYVDQEFLFSVSVLNSVLSVSSEQLQKTSLEFFVSSETIERIENSENKIDEVREAYKSGEIQVVKKSIRNKIVFWFAKFFI